MTRQYGDHQLQYRNSRPMSREDYIEFRYGRAVKSELIEEIGDGEYIAYLEEYWEYTNDYKDYE